MSGPSARRTGGLPATEGDLIVGRNGASAASTLVERAARFLVLLPVASRDSATATATATAGGCMAGLPNAMRASLTWDCGAEMAQHAALTLAAGIDVYFAHPLPLGAGH
jgi:IS30 family transposase